MRRMFAIGIVVALALVVSTAVRAQETEDSVVGSGSAGPLFTSIQIDAHSGPSGENPSGTVSFAVFGGTVLSGPVTCLAVNEIVATIGFTDTTAGFGNTQVRVVDGARDGFADTFGAVPTPNDCATPADMPFETLQSGDIVVTDAAPLPIPTSKEQCKKGGWRNHTDDQGQPFEDQGQCIDFVNQHT